MKKEEKIIEPFDYGNIKENEKKTVLEILNLINQSPTDMSLKMFAKFIEHKFQLKDVPRFDVMQTEFIQKALKIGLTPQIHGWVQSKTAENEDIQFPIVYFSADIKKFIELTLELKK